MVFLLPQDIENSAKAPVGKRSQLGTVTSITESHEHLEGLNSTTR